MLNLSDKFIFSYADFLLRTVPGIMVVFWLHDAGDPHVLFELAIKRSFLFDWEVNISYITQTFYLWRLPASWKFSGSVMLETIILYPGMRYRFYFFPF